MSILLFFSFLFERAIILIRMSMDSSVDTRRIRRQAKSLLKSASCGDRIVAQNIGKCRMQSTSKFDSVTSLQGGGSQSSQFLGGENSLLFQQSSVEAMSRPSTRQYKEKHFKQRCWEIFTKYGRMPGDQPLDQCTLGLPSHSLEAAMSELMGRSVPKEAKGKSLMEGNISLSWSDFKSYAKDVFANLPGGSEDMFNNSSSYGGGGSLDELDTSMFSGSYKHLLQRHRSASHIVFDDLEDRNISDNNHGSLKISEKLVPISIVKDAAVKILRKESTELRKGKGKCEGERSVSQLKGPTTTEVESSTSVLKISMSDSMKSLLDTSELAATSTTNDSQHLRRNSLDISFPHIRPFETKMDLSAGFTKLTEKQRMVGLFNQAEEYPSKWLAMKTKRDERRAREEARRNRNNIRHSVQQIVMNAERSEFDRVQEEILHTREDTVMRNKMLQDEKNFAMKHNIKTRREKDRETKRREAMYLRDTIDDSTSAMKSMLNDEVSTIRKKNAQNAFELNSVTSTIIPIPDKLQANLRNAKRYVCGMLGFSYRFKIMNTVFCCLFHTMVTVLFSSFFLSFSSVV